MGKTIAILGSTGSIGTQTLEVVRENGDIQVAALSAGGNISLLEELLFFLLHNNQYHLRNIKVLP